ncbi:ribosomal protein S18 acetylase RimI-like enzyme [Virgibacillus natechei]|uniref:Ribosomal protein S18 acetylase RimI-like enzyme n=1 Tax=Virgibacillus natechei TaxID=1216297 RepID=A0ABS4IFQ9_9BACI|nr:GNAT family N-acetyltransferase [Virgibacillus natechei]MBP1969775.1 ribosomal protein S18 acetylase RimI-like enzyme [Virgibacillus natechei]UZD12683.1 GNAT family N-acetyltransferase [Virgibacillus natechei]
MKQITFDDIYILGNIVAENDLYRHYHYPEMLIRYDSNFIDFKKQPSLTELKKAEKYLREFHLRQGQKHVKFCFPENMQLERELVDYLNDSGYENGFLELYGIQPDQFPEVEDQPDIDIQIVTDKNFETYLDLQYKQDLGFGSEFARAKMDLAKRQFKEESRIMRVLAFYKGNPAGYVDVITTDKTAEIDNLTVVEAFQKKGIGSRLQKFVMDTYPDKTVILVADGEDTAREMYMKQNYHYLGFQNEVQKI